MKKTKNSATWRLLDARLPLMPGRDYPTTVIDNAGTLQRELGRWAKGRPGILILKNPTGEMLLVGLGGPVGIVESVRPPNGSHRIAWTDTPYSADSIEFQMEGLGAPFHPRHLLPMEKVIDIVLHYYTFHQLPNWIKWGPRTLEDAQDYCKRSRPGR
jgi:hypothetical protein